MLKFSSIYFDSNQLIRAGWPKLSAKLQSILSLARAVKVTPFLLEPVEKELEAHCVREYWEALGKNPFDKPLKAANALERFVVPTGEDYRKYYLETAANTIKEFQIERAPLTPRNLAELFEMAIWHQKPFLKNGSGFQDAVILVSAIDHASSVRADGAFFAVDYKAFDQASVERLANKSGVSLQLFTKDDDLLKSLEEDLVQKFRDAWERENKAAVAAVEKKLEAVEAFIGAKLEIPERWGAQKIVELKGIRIRKVHNAVTPLPHERERNGPMRFTATVQIEIDAVVEDNAFPYLAAALASRCFKLNAEPRTVPLSSLLQMRSPVKKETELTEVVDVEFEATTEEDAIKDIRPISLTSKTGMTE